jgi:hypothetical protein
MNDSFYIKIVRKKKHILLSDLVQIIKSILLLAPVFPSPYLLPNDFFFQGPSQNNIT